MCGIAGIYNFKKRDINKDYINWCISTMRHRGPDDQQVWDNGENYIAAFARLAIQDTSPAANQPMFSSCGKYCITYNGEIYNAEELKQNLKPFDIIFKSRSDTEALLYAIIHLGIKKTLEITDGIFAFAFYNINRNKLILARDRVGAKPLYIGYNDDGLIYSSQYDHIINFPPLAANAFNQNAVGAYFSLGYIPEDSGAYQNTKMLLHGHYYEVFENAIRAYQYYDYPLHVQQCGVQNVDDILEKSVSSQLVSDVPLGTFMSGGVDSTLITYFAKKRNAVKTFTIGSRDKIFDESAAAAGYAKIFGVENFCQFMEGNEFEKLLAENSKAYTEPFADYSSLPALLLSKFAKEKITVALSGDGGDELFFGYWKNAKVLKTLKYYSSNNSLLRKIKLLKGKLQKEDTADISRHWSEESFLSYCYHSLYIIGALHFTPLIFNAEAEEAWWYKKLKQNFNESETMHTGMYALRKLEADIHLQRMLLKVDRAGMYHSLEIRVPFLSNDMLKYSAGLAYSDCIKDGQGKMNLKESLIKKAGREMVMQPKKGFDIPINNFIRGSLRKEFEEKIFGMPRSLSYMFNKKELEKLWQQHQQKKNNAGWLLWAVYSFINWHHTHANRYKENTFSK